MHYFALLLWLFAWRIDFGLCIYLGLANGSLIKTIWNNFRFYCLLCLYQLIWVLQLMCTNDFLFENTIHHHLLVWVNTCIFRLLRLHLILFSNRFQVWIVCANTYKFTVQILLSAIIRWMILKCIHGVWSYCANIVSLSYLLLLQQTLTAGIILLISVKKLHHLLIHQRICFFVQNRLLAIVLCLLYGRPHFDVLLVHEDMPLVLHLLFSCCF